MWADSRVTLTRCFAGRPLRAEEQLPVRTHKLLPPAELKSKERKGARKAGPGNSAAGKSKKKRGHKAVDNDVDLLHNGDYAQPPEEVSMADISPDVFFWPYNARLAHTVAK